MRRIIISLSILLIPYYVLGQLYSVSDYYAHHALAINPAYSGSSDALSTTLLHRNSRNGFEGSPKTTSLLVHAPLFNEKVGVGFFILNDNIGVSTENIFIGNYAYRINLGYGKLALGLGFGIIIQNTAWDQLEALDADDEQLADKTTTGVLPDFSTGIYYTTEEYFIGLSVPLFLSHDYSAGTDKYTTRNDFGEYNYFCNAGYNFTLNENLRFSPSFLIKFHRGNPVQIDINSELVIKNRIGFGASYRSKEVLVGMLICQINDQLRVAYSYDFSIGKTNQNWNNAHEIMLSYEFNYKVQAAGPRQF